MPTKKQNKNSNKDQEELQYWKHKTEELQRALNASIAGILVLDKKLNIIFVNQAWLDFFSLPKNKKVIGATMGQVFCNKNNLANLKKILIKIKSTEPLDTEITLGAKDDVYLWTRIILNPSTNNYVLTGRDIASQKIIEDQLRQSEKQFRGVFENAAIGLALVAPDGSWLRVNKSLCDIVGYSEEELLKSSFQKITHPDDLNKDLDQVKQVLDGNISTYTMEKRYFHKKGNVIWVLLTVSLVRDSDGKPVHFVSQVVDITKIKKSETEKDTKASNLEKLNNLMIGRELKMVELKNKIKNLENTIAKLKSK